MSKTLLVLGASRYQMDAIRTARRLGCRVITTDNTPDNPGHAIADQAYGIDSTDVEAVLDLARSARINGIIAPCTDVAVSTAAYVAEELGLPGPPLAAARTATDKIAFRQFLQQHRLPCPRFYTLPPGTLPPAEMWDASPTWIIKPDRSSGSKGIFMIRSPDELASRLAESRSFSPSGTVVVEEFFEGHQGTVEGVLKDGRIILHFILDRQTAHAPYVTTVGHRLPTLLLQSVQQQIVQHLEQVWSLLGIREGVFDCDFVHSRGQTYLIEITPRLGGNSISQLIRRAAGVDLVEVAVQQACDEPSVVPSRVTLKPAAVVLLGVWESGILQFDNDRVQTLRSQPWLDSLELDVSSGSPVEPFVNGRHRIGEAYLHADSPHALAELEHRLHQELGLEVRCA